MYSILPKQQIYRKYIIFCNIEKMSLRPVEITSRAGFGPRAVVWRPLVCTIARALKKKQGSRRLTHAFKPFPNRPLHYSSVGRYRDQDLPSVVSDSFVPFNPTQLPYWTGVFSGAVAVCKYANLLLKYANLLLKYANFLLKLNFTSLYPTFNKHHK